MLPKRIKDKLIILGTGRTITGAYAADADLNYEIWGLNNCYKIWFNPVHRWFELHQIEDIKKWGKKVYIRRGEEEWAGDSVNNHIKRLAKLNIPVFMHRKLSAVPKSVEFPFLDILNYFDFHYFTCTISWQLALAIMMGYKEIRLYGIELEEYNERKYQRPSVEYFLGLAQGKGVKTYIPKDSSLLKAPFLYGFEHENQYK